MITDILHKLLTAKEKMLFFLGVFATGIISSFFVAVPAFAMSGMGDPSGIPDTKNMSPLMRLIEVNNPLYIPIDVSLDVLSAVLMFIAALVIIRSIREYGKSTLGIALIYFFNATLVLGAIRLIFILDDDNIYHVNDITEMTAWHFLFYYAIFLFFIAGKTLTGLVSSGKGKTSYVNAIYLFIFSFIISVVIIASIPMPIVQDFLTKYLENTWFNTFGWFHIIALVMAGAIAVFLYRVKNKFKGFAGVIGDLYISLALLAFIHAWELINESWHLLIVSDNFGEFVERCIWIPVFIFILYSFMRLRKMATAAPAVATETITQPSTPVPTVPPPTQNPTDTFAMHSIPETPEITEKSETQEKSIL